MIAEELAGTAGRSVELLALGEVMLRLDPGEARIRSARSFAVYEGGGEYNVARALSSTFGRRTGLVTALVDNEVGRLAESLVRAAGVDVRHVVWQPFDGVGRAARVGLNFVERGHGVRPPLGVSDRGHSAASLLAPGDLDWVEVLGGARWLHTGGVFAGLSDTTGATALEAVTTARRLGLVVSYDLNHRPSLWQDRGGDDGARRAHAALLPHAHVVFGSPQHVAGALGLDGTEGATMEDLAPRVARELPCLRLLADTTRQVRSASRQRWTGALWSPGTGVVVGPVYDDLEVLDRVGAGDAFAAGVLHGLLAGDDLAPTLELALAAGAHAMTTPGDVLTASLGELRAVAAGATGFLR